ncbi:hypothetical protein Q2941_16540 [Bradyrhizobium sp. UFLA05-153]
MKHPMINAIAALAVLAAAASMLMWHVPSTKIAAGTNPMPSVRELHDRANANKLPDQEIEDQSVVFAGPTKR